MLVSLVLTIQPKEDLSLPKTSGNFIYACFLEMIGKISTDMAEELHQAKRDKPFTVSSLQGEFIKEDDKLLISQDKEYWIRFTSIKESLSELLIRLEGNPPDEIKLFDGRFKVLKAMKDKLQHNWADAITYEELYNKRIATQQKPNERIRLRFYSPTTFRSSKLNIPLPLPRFIFFGLQEKWNRYSPVFLGKDISRLGDENIYITRHCINTQVFDFGRYKQVGFIGEAEFEVDTTLYDGLFAKIINLLADFAFFAGVGYKTTMGMGQTRRIE